jgi:hypothetical protein
MSYDPNSSFVDNFTQLLFNQFCFDNADTFETKHAARTKLEINERKIRFAQRHCDFNVKYCANEARQAKRNNYVLCAAFKRAIPKQRTARK